MSRIVERDIDDNKPEEITSFGKVEGLGRNQDFAKLNASHEEPINKNKVEKSSERSSFSGVLLRLIVIAFIVVLGYFAIKFMGNPFAGLMDRDASYSSNQGQLIEIDKQQIMVSLQNQKQALDQLEGKMTVLQAQQNNRFSQAEERIDGVEDRVAELEASILELTKTIADMEMKTHTVKRGETLWRISNQYYGSSLYIDSLAKYNKLANPRLIVTGSKLLIPPANQLK